MQYNGLQVIYPTRNRAAMALEAIRAVLEQADPDLRILISDNSTDDEQSNSLQRSVEDLADRRVRYLRPPRSLNVGPHWDWAIAQAMESSDRNHFTVLTDRLLPKSGALPSLLDRVREAPDKLITYPRENVFDHRSPIRLTLYPATRRLVELNAAHLLRLLARGYILPALPFLLNCVVPRSMFAALHARYGDYALSIAPDCAFCCRILSQIDSILYFDAPIMVVHGYSVSTSFGWMRGHLSKATKDFVAAFDPNVFRDTVPAPDLVTPLNFLMHEYALVQRTAANLPPIDRNGYFEMLQRELFFMENAPLRRAAQRRLDEYRQSARASPPVRRSSASWRDTGAALKRRLLWELQAPWARPLRSLLNHASQLRSRRQQHRFVNAAEAIRFAREASAPLQKRSLYLDLATGDREV